MSDPVPGLDEDEDDQEYSSTPQATPGDVHSNAAASVFDITSSPPDHRSGDNVKMDNSSTGAPQPSTTLMHSGKKMMRITLAKEWSPVRPERQVLSRTPSLLKHLRLGQVDQ